MQQSVLQVGTFNDNVVREREATLKRAASDATVEHFRLGTVISNPARHHQRVVLHGQVEIFRAEPCHRHCQAIAVVADFFDVVGGIRLRVLAGRRRVNQTRQPIEADGGTEKWSKIYGSHRKTSCKARSCSGRPEWADPGLVPRTPKGRSRHSRS